MPANPILLLGDVIEFTAKGQEATAHQDVLNRIYFRVSAVPATPTLNLMQAAELLIGLWNTTIVTKLSVEYFVYEGVAKLVSGVTLSPPTGPYVRPVWTFSQGAVTVQGQLGSEAGERFPTYVTCSVRLRTGYLGRYWRGGVRIGLIPLTAQDTTQSDEVSNAYWTALQTKVNLFFMGLTSAGTTLAPVIASPTYYYYVMGGVGPFADSVADVTSSTLSRFFSTQESRKAPKSP